MLKFGKQVYKLDTVDSTNNFAANLINEGLAENGAVVMAAFQSSGRGQRGNSWLAAKGMNLTASFIYFPDNLALTQVSVLNWWVSLSVIRVLEHYGVPAQIKWPNDIYVNHLKLAGLLIETSNSGNLVKSAVIGVGLNANQLDFGSMNATSIKKQTGLQVPITDLCWSMCDALTFYLPLLQTPSLLHKAYVERLFKLNSEAEFIFQGKQQSGLVLGVDEVGKLMVQFPHGVENLEHGQLTWVLPTPI